MTQPTTEEHAMGYPHFSVDCHEFHSLVRNFRGPKPTIVTLCGSTRFRAEFEQVNAELTLAGRIVISVGVFGHADGIVLADDTKAALDDLHKRKIDLADEVFVVNPGGYIGQSTRGEIEYATAAGKPIRYLVDAEAPA